MFFQLRLFFLLQLVHLCSSNHYKGGSLSWRPLTPNVLTGSIPIMITERHTFTLSRYPCNRTTINGTGFLNDTLTGIAPTISCISSSSNCTASLYQNMTSPLYCTDFSTTFQISTGTYYTNQSLSANSIIDIAWRGTSWATSILTNGWSLVAHIDLTPINNKINTSPVTGSLPIFQTYVNELTVIQILAGDWDPEQTVRCRWSNQIPTDECGDVCLDLPNAVISPLNCAITWTPILRPADIASGVNISTYVVSITAEDFVNSSSTTPLSSVPHQVLVYVSARPPGTCPYRPNIYNYPRRNLACYASTIGSTNYINFQASVSSVCWNDTIVDFIATSPLYLQKSDIFLYFNSTVYGINIAWTPTANQTGLQPLCMASVDNHGQTSAQYCVMIVVQNVGNPSLGYPTFIQGTASPVGTVLSTQTRFSIQSNQLLRRTTLNQTWIEIYRLDTTNRVVLLDCKYSPDVYYLNSTIVFFVRNPPWILGLTYFITMTQGVATAYAYCGLESGGFGGNNTWRFTIWGPGVSSTTTPSTTTSTATTHTVTTRSLGTTTYNTLYTTTGLPLSTTTVLATTTSTTTTTVTTSTTTSETTSTTTTTTTTAYITDVQVIYPKDMETACLQPVTIATALITLITFPLHVYGMITLFVKMNSHFEQLKVRGRVIRRARVGTAQNLEEQTTFV